ncbi:hypothetical protein TWF506_011349 [Arthrobotrys conoides]|uniref:Uncharacterized protein n=1 Tax=Arthrobotrys conoides TaxID=74498 RepID=A0AAN8N640_9PEZI
MPWFSRFRKPEAAPQQSAEPEPPSPSLPVRHGETFIAPQRPRRVIPAPGLFIKPIPRCRPHQYELTPPPEENVAFEGIRYPQPALTASSMPTTSSGSVQSFRPDSAVYYCRYSEDGIRSDIASQSGKDSDGGMAGYCVFRESDLAANNPAEVLSPPLKDYEIDEEWKSTGEVSSPAVTITAGGLKLQDPLESTDTLIRYPIGRRISAFTEVLSFESSEDGQSTTLEEREIQSGIDRIPLLPRSEKILYVYSPWILRSMYVLMLANWWTLIPLMNLASKGFHPENLPLLYSCGMLIVITLNLGLQLNYFRVHGTPWGRRRSAEKARDENEPTERNNRQGPTGGVYARRNDAGPGPDIDLEANRCGSRTTLKKDRNRKGCQLRTGMESYVFAVDMILFMLTLAALAVSIVFARHRSVMHELQMMEAARNATLGGGDGDIRSNLRVVEVYGDDKGYKLF